MPDFEVSKLWVWHSRYCKYIFIWAVELGPLPNTGVCYGVTSDYPPHYQHSVASDGFNKWYPNLHDIVCPEIWHFSGHTYLRTTSGMQYYVIPYQLIGRQSNDIHIC